MDNNAFVDPIINNITIKLYGINNLPNVEINKNKIEQNIVI